MIAFCCYIVIRSRRASPWKNWILPAALSPRYTVYTLSQVYSIIHCHKNNLNLLIQPKPGAVYVRLHRSGSKTRHMTLPLHAAAVYSLGFHAEVQMFFGTVYIAEEITSDVFCI